MQYTSILLIDDDNDDRFFFKTAVSELDERIKCDTLNSAIDALNSLKRSPALPHLIFLDLNMPMMSGFEFLKLLKSEPRYAAIPVIIYSTSSNPDDVQKAKHLGASAYFCKPSSYIDLYEKLTKILEMDFRVGENNYQLLR